MEESMSPPEQQGQTQKKRKTKKDEDDDERDRDDSVEQSGRARTSATTSVSRRLQAVRAKIAARSSLHYR
jgi:hypothetical protein